ncbi:GATA-type zinc finger protein 1 [Hippocampus comes]|uniref:Zinc finger GATA like protein 1 n=1 Tax=Hippocampus comes TaxID=109280 RepID=A0A3Q2YJW8_HIPCM|nr:PREDICTED: GATA-type zinc finger protein 1 [Hippocampus comes]XP_019717255.1 PREDICTED: GATA-type zinc finger protein 1 [Hippocampus comes]
MSAGQRSQVALFESHQREAEQDASESAVLYLFHEVSKLEASLQSGVLDTGSLNDSQDEKVERAQASVNPNLLSTYEHNERLVCGKGEIESPPGGHSPWRVLSLINLQCERLMDLGEEHADSRLFFPTECGVASAHKSGTGASVECTLRPSPVAGIATCGVPVVDEQENCFASKAETGDKEMTFRGPPPMLDKDAAEEQAPVSSRQSKTQPVSSVDMLEGSHDRSSAEHHNADTHVFESSLSLVHMPDTSLNREKDFDSDSVKRTWPAGTLDHNANLMLGSHWPSKPDDGMLPSKSHSAHAPIEEKPQRSPATTVTSHLRSKEGSATPVAQHLWRNKTARKQANPSRSGDIHDPRFQGVAFRMNAELNGSRQQCRLRITSKYSKVHCRSLWKQRRRTQTSRTTSNSEEDSEPSASGGKVCASCCTRKTPMWRDAEDGTPLCNACGIRYKKYRVRCVNCWHIPRKESNSNSHCLKCGHFVRVTSTQYKHTT